MVDAADEVMVGEQHGNGDHQAEAGGEQRLRDATRQGGRVTHGAFPGHHVEALGDAEHGAQQPQQRRGVGNDPDGPHGAAEPPAHAVHGFLDRGLDLVRGAVAPAVTDLENAVQTDALIPRQARLRRRLRVRRLQPPRRGQRQDPVAAQLERGLESQGQADDRERQDDIHDVTPSLELAPEVAAEIDGHSCRVGAWTARGQQNDRQQKAGGERTRTEPAEPVHAISGFFEAHGAFLLPAS